MTKKDIVLKVANVTGMRQHDVKAIVQETLNVIVDGLSNGQTIELRNFGILKIKLRQQRIGRNPKTGQPVLVPAKKIVSFKPGLYLSNLVK
ncbi:MAG: integration host factor subunit beta [Candidatus Omnitrophota bacterium]|nr:MAG: integration host factor subunit beta [Candidatus Omnitrophota bacterium]